MLEELQKQFGSQRKQISYENMGRVSEETIVRLEECIQELALKDVSSNRQKLSLDNSQSVKPHKSPKREDILLQGSNKVGSKAYQMFASHKA